MSKVTFEMDGDEYCQLMSYKQLGTIDEWAELKKIKDNSPIFIECREYDGFGNCRKHTKYFSKDELYKELVKLNKESGDELDRCVFENRQLVGKIKNTSFKNRLKYLFTGII